MQDVYDLGVLTWKRRNRSTRFRQTPTTRDRWWWYRDNHQSGSSRACNDTRQDKRSYERRYIIKEVDRNHHDWELEKCEKRSRFSTIPSCERWTLYGEQCFQNELNRSTRKAEKKSCEDYSQHGSLRKVEIDTDGERTILVSRDE